MFFYFIISIVTLLLFDISDTKVAMQDFKIIDIQSQQESSLARLVRSHECKEFLKPASLYKTRSSSPTFICYNLMTKK